MIVLHVFNLMMAPILLVAVIIVLNHFASKEVPWYVRSVVGYAWFVSMSIVVLVPLDVWTAMKKDDPEYINVLWLITYWSTQFVTWLMIPIGQGYIQSGDFTFGDKLKSSLKFNGLIWATMAVLGIVGVSYLLASGRMTWHNLQGYAIACSNTFGLIGGVFLLSYGLVEIPRGFWLKARITTQLLYKTQRVGLVADTLDRSHKELSKVLMIVRATTTQMPRRSVLRPYMDVIETEAGQLSDVLQEDFKPSWSGTLSEDDMDYDTDKESLAKLRRRLRRAIDQYKRASGQYKSLVYDAFELEDIVSNATGELSNGHDMHFKSTIRQPRSGPFASFLDRVEFIYKCWLHMWVYRALSLILGMLSLAVIVAEATIATHGHPDLSLFSIIIRRATGSEALVQLLVCAPLVYICACAYFSLFRIGLFAIFMLVPKHTDSYSLFVNASLMCRFAAPLAYNYVNIIHMDKKSGYDTVFTRKMGAMSDVPLFGTYLNSYFPIMVVLFCLCVFLNVFNRIAAFFFRSRRFKFEDTYSDEFIEKGRDILHRERENQQNCEGIWATSAVPLSSRDPDMESGSTPLKAAPFGRTRSTSNLSTSPKTSKASSASSLTGVAVSQAEQQARWEDMKARLSSKVAETALASGLPRGSKRTSSFGTNGGAGANGSTRLSPNNSVVGNLLGTNGAGTGAGSTLDNIFSSLRLKRLDDDDFDDDPTESTGLFSGRK